MDLSSMKKKTAPTAEFEYDAGMKVTLSYISPETVRKMLKACRTMSQGMERLDDDKFLEELTEHIASWTGFTLGRVSKLLEIEVPAGDEDKEVPCTKQNKLEMLKNAWGFKIWVDEKSRELSGFVAAQKELERKNSSGSPSGTSPQAPQAATTAGK